MKRSITLAAACLSLALSAPRMAAAADPFNDTTCPAANDPSRHLNAAFATGNAILTDDLMQTAEQIAAAYKGCMDQFDHEQQARGPHEQELSSDEALVGRLYTRLQYARAEQRVGKFHASAKQNADARAAYGSAFDALDQADAIVRGTLVTDGSERKLLDELHSLRPDVADALKQLPADASTPAPASSPAATGSLKAP